jgi:hypothetical protein
MRVHDRKRVDECAQQLINRTLPLRLPSHALDERSLVAPITEDHGILVSRDHRNHLVKDLTLLLLIIGPERVLILTAVIAHDHPGKVDESLNGVAFKV